jgi:signal transduction histidine kinase
MASRSRLVRKLFVLHALLMIGLLALCAATAAGPDGPAELPTAFWAAAIATLAVALVPVVAMGWFFNLPVAEITRAARQLSGGVVADRIVLGGSEELSDLGEAFNEMRERLVNQIRTIDRQRRNLEVLVAGLEEGVIVADAEGQVVLSNPAARRMLGGPAGDAGESDGADPWRGRLMEAVIGHHELQKMLLADPPSERRVGQERTVELENSDGRRVTLRARSGDLPLETAGAGPRTGRLLVLSDITELTQSLRVKADFIANASHELRTPLNTMHMALENLQSMDRVTEADTAQRFVNMALGHCRRLEALVRDMLDLSRVENPAARFRAEAVVPARFFAELHVRFTDRLAAKQLQWRLDCPDDAQLVANPHLMTLVFDNLVDNACKFTPAGGMISVAVRPTGDRRIEVAVTDTGCGIPAGDQGRVFERFYQVDRARSGPERGTGLGLSIVKHAVAAMDGTVRLESEVGKGTTLFVTLPEVRS